VAVVLIPVQTKQIRINIHKGNNTKITYSTNNTNPSKYSKAELGERDGERLNTGRKNKSNERCVRVDGPDVYG